MDGFRSWNPCGNGQKASAVNGAEKVCPNIVRIFFKTAYVVA